MGAGNFLGCSQWFRRQIVLYLSKNFSSQVVHLALISSPINYLLLDHLCKNLEILAPLFYSDTHAEDKIVLVILSADKKESGVRIQESEYRSQNTPPMNANSVP
jgi:hypothetical protein